MTPRAARPATPRVPSRCWAARPGAFASARLRARPARLRSAARHGADVCAACGAPRRCARGGDAALGDECDAADRGERTPSFLLSRSCTAGPSRCVGHRREVGVLRLGDVCRVNEPKLLRCAANDRRAPLVGTPFLGGGPPPAARRLRRAGALRRRRPLLQAARRPRDRAAVGDRGLRRRRVALHRRRLSSARVEVDPARRRQRRRRRLPHVRRVAVGRRQRRAAASAPAPAACRSRRCKRASRRRCRPSTPKPPAAAAGGGAPRFAYPGSLAPTRGGRAVGADGPHARPSRAVGAARRTSAHSSDARAAGGDARRPRRARVADSAGCRRGWRGSSARGGDDGVALAPSA